MKCEKCGGKTSVVDSHPIQNNQIRRRRKCLSCDFRFNTFELTDKSLNAQQTFKPVKVKIQLGQPIILVT